MLLVLKAGAAEEDVAQMTEALRRLNLITLDIQGESTKMIGLAGDTSGLDPETFELFPCVERVMKVQEPYKLAGRRFHPKPTVVDCGGIKVGGGHFAVMAGPCSVESEEQILTVAREVKQSGASFLRGGAFKPRSSPYVFQGLGLDGLDLLRIAKQKTGLPIVTELMDTTHLDAFARYVDVIQIGARNMQNFTLLREVGKLGKPVLLKRGLSSTIEELLMAAEYLMAAGTKDVLLCERGIRTFETATRNTLDVSAVPVLKEKSHLPVIVDPSHATGRWNLVPTMALAAVAAGADGLIIEVHNNPQMALCDGAQSVTPAVFRDIMRKISRVRAAIEEE